ncbi:50S ribosomal protein L32 [Patescibacteria group bacterium]|nr:50S ribosomal protein L32 [Patescibacteria group bacterium]MBU1922400.1 50S ribosomal protein L32 [Patescibacteria group bacterium]
MVQKKRRTKSQGRRRASHFALKGANLNKCAHCGQAAMPHQACEFCGYYRGRQVIEVEAKKLKQLEKEEKAKAKEEKGKGEKGKKK